MKIEDVVEYIKNDSEIAIPLSRLFNDDGSHITKKQYGLIVLEILCEELKNKFGEL